MAESHFIKGLYNHLRTSEVTKYTELLGDKGKLNSLVSDFEHYSETLIRFLKLIKDEVEKNKTIVNYTEDFKPGLTKWFIITIWNDALCKANGSNWITDSWYKSSASASNPELWELKCGAYPIGTVEGRNTLNNYENWHKSLRAKYASHSLARAISAKGAEISETIKEVRERLQEFSDLKHLPGQCELC